MATCSINPDDHDNDDPIFFFFSSTFLTGSFSCCR
jgi:hypothetical protein